MYRELAIRLRRFQSHKNSPVLMEAEALGFKEDGVHKLPSAPSLSSLKCWLELAGDEGVLRILGLRSTVGTDPGKLLPPSWSKLLDAAMAQHNSRVKLSVAARARAKHANRSTDSFYGSVKGNDEEQNTAASVLVGKVLSEAIWINIHTFGGMDGRPVLEVRVASGYGARWVANWSDPRHPKEIQFRGFLEPTMEDGHEKGWKH